MTVVVMIYNIRMVLRADDTDGGAGTQDDLKFENLSTGTTVTGTGDRAGTATDGIDTLSFSDIEDLVGSKLC